jgi:catechol 2,3-dioxygenase-like lactoylglutathione lyase family enzyme
MTIEHSGGILGQTFICTDLERSGRFLTELLGLRLVKRTVHHHDWRLPVSHFSVGPDTGEGGAGVITYVGWSPVFYELPPDGLVDAETTRRALDSPRAGDFRGRWGAGTNHHLALHADSRQQLLRWKRRLTDAGVHVTGPYFRSYFHAIYFRDPDGAILEIATTEPGFAHDEEILGSGHREAPAEAMVGARSEQEVAAETWEESLPEITPEMRLLGLHHNTSVSSDIDRTTEFLVESVGLPLIKRTDYLDQEGATHYYYSALEQPEPGAILTFFGFPGYGRGRLGVGLSHEITLRARDDDALGAWREQLLSAGTEVGEIEELGYSRGASFRDPDGHLLRIATEPEFTIDEPAGSLGERLCLPERMESRRTEIERFHELRPAP